MAPQSVDDVLDRLRGIDGELRGRDGVKVFNRMYLTVTEEVARRLRTRSAFRDAAFMAELDVAFAGLWIDAYDAARQRHRVPRAWAPLFALRRRSNLLPIQFALAGMNAHIEHDLPLAVVRTCARRRTTPRNAKVRHDYDAVNAVLASVEEPIRRSFLTELERAADEHIGPLAHVVSSWNIDKARDLAWVNVEALWSMRRLPTLQQRYVEALGHTVGMTSRYLLTPAAPVLR